MLYLRYVILSHHVVKVNNSVIGCFGHTMVAHEDDIHNVGEVTGAKGRMNGGSEVVDIYDDRLKEQSVSERLSLRERIDRLTSTNFDVGPV